MGEFSSRISLFLAINNNKLIRSRINLECYFRSDLKWTQNLNSVNDTQQQYLVAFSYRIKL